MTATALLETALLMGLLVLAGGSYACLYALGRLWTRSGLVFAGQVCWLIAFGAALVIAFGTPLDVKWKLLLLASAVVYVIIPPITWRYLERLHIDEG